MKKKLKIISEKKNVGKKKFGKKYLETKIFITKMYNTINQCDTILTLLAPMDRNREKERE